jgi:hypothetical protein
MATTSRFRRELALAHRPRSVADLAAEGVTRAMLAGTKWRAVCRGFHVPVVPDENITPTQRILDRLPLLPRGGAIGGWGAAFVHGVDELDGIDPCSFAQKDILLCLGGALTRATREGVQYSYERLPAGDVVEVSGIPVTTIVRTGFDGARFAPSLREAVAFIDPLLRATGTSPAQLVTYADGLGPGWKGIGQARCAIGLANPAARNGWESRLRVWWIVEAGWPPPEVNIPVFDLDGRLVGIPDLLDVEAGTVLEFDGELHRRRRRHRKDNVREEDFEDLGLQVVRADSLDLLHHEPELHHRVSRARLRGLRRDRRHDRWTLKEPAWFRAESGHSWDVALTDEQKAELFGRWRI